MARVPAGWQVTLTDFSPGMVAQAQATLDQVSPQDPRFTFERADALALPAASGSLDAVIANHMLYHVPDVPAALAEFRRVLKPGGRLFAATNGAGHMREQWALVARYAGEGSTEWHTVLTRAFSLQNGAERIGAHFAHVERHDYADALHVTEAAALVAYVASMNLVPEAELEPFTAFVAAELETAGGVIRIDKETGLFVAW
jgi:SAM-dependent methyltransferase